MDKVFTDATELSTPKYRWWHGGGVIGTNTHDGAITRIEAVPVSVWVQLYSVIGGSRVASVKSNALGEWEITHLDPKQYFFARIRDPSAGVNGALLDWILPVVPD